MADPRNTLDWSGIGKRNDPFNYDASIVFNAALPGGAAQVGMAVMLTADSTVGLATDGAAIVGRLEQVESDGKCAVQTQGFMQLPGGTAATLTRGGGIVGAAGISVAGIVTGYVRSPAATVAEALLAHGKITAAGVAAAVWVSFP